MGVNVKGGAKPAAGAPEGEQTVELTKSEIKAAPEAPEAIEHPENHEMGSHVTSNPTNVEENELSIDSTHPRSVLIGSGEAQLDYLALEAKRDSGLTTQKWNELDRDERSTLLQNTIDRLRQEAEAEKPSTSAPTGDTTGEVTDARVHADRGIGGRYVALGGGERIRVADASTNADPIPNDDDLKVA